MKFIKESEIERTNENLKIKASQFLIGGLGAFATKDFDKVGTTIAYYMGSKISSEESDTDDYSYKLTDNLFISPSKPNKQDNRFQKQPLCKAAFFNDSIGTDFPYSVAFVGGSTFYKVVSDDSKLTNSPVWSSPETTSSSPPKKKVRVEKDEEEDDEDTVFENDIFAVKVKTIRPIKKGEELFLFYGSSYWSTKKTEIQRDLNLGAAPLDGTSVAKAEPFRFFHFSKIDTNSITKTLDSVVWVGIVPPKDIQEWKDGDFGLSKHKVLEQASKEKEMSKILLSVPLFTDFLKRTLVDQELDRAIETSLNKVASAGALYNALHHDVAFMMDNISTNFLLLHKAGIFFSDSRDQLYQVVTQKGLAISQEQEEEAKKFAYIELLFNEYLPLILQHARDYKSFNAQGRRLSKMVTEISRESRDALLLDKIGRFHEIVKTIDQFLEYLVKWQEEKGVLPKSDSTTTTDKSPPRKSARNPKTRGKNK